MTLPNSFVATPLLSGGDDSDMLVAVAGPVPGASMSPAAVNPVATISPNTAITNWSSAPITDWPSTPSSFQKREALASLSKRCPLVNEEVLLIVLEEHNFVVANAADLLLGVGMDDAMSAFLIKVFPQVPCRVINDHLSTCYRRYFETFTSLVKEFHPYWNPRPLALPSALSLSPPTTYRPDFTSDGPIEMDKESSWWLTLANTVRWQVSEPSPDNHTWTTVVKACMLSPKSYSPCLADLASRLTGLECGTALSTLVLLLAYSTMIGLAANAAFHGICTRIVHVLATHGMASPGAVAWLYECASTDTDLQSSLLTSIPLYLKLSSSIWATRNTVLYAYRAKAALPRSGQLIIDVDAPSIISSSGALDDTSIALAPVSPSVSCATWISAGSKSKKPAPYPPSKPPARRRATNDDVRAAQTLVRPPAPPLPEEVIELTSDSGLSEATDIATRTAVRAPSPFLPVVSPEPKSASDPDTPTPAPVIMSPSPLPVCRAKGAKTTSN